MRIKFVILVLLWSVVTYSQNKLKVSYISNSEFLITIDNQTHNDYGCSYPITYEFSFFDDFTNLNPFIKYSKSDSWTNVEKKTTDDFFNGVEVVRIDYSQKLIFASLAFNKNSDSIFIKVTDKNNLPIDLQFNKVCEYYDNRDAVVTTTADDWCMYNTYEFGRAIDLFRSRNLWFSGAIITDSVNRTNPETWDIMQGQLDLGLVEVLSHSRTHQQIPYDYESEIIGSKNDILKNLELPKLFRKNGKEYIYSYVNPYGQNNDQVELSAAQAKYLVVRGIFKWFYDFSRWDVEKQIYPYTNLAYEIGPLWDGETDLNVLNQTFDHILNINKIYHFFIHPVVINDYDLWGTLEQHLDHISNRKNVWYVAFGHLYLYHYLFDNLTSNENYLSVTPDNLNFNSNSGSSEVSVSSNMSWDVSEDLDWVSVDPKSGQNNQIILVSVDENTSDQPRNGTIYFTNKESSKELSIHQNGAAPTLSLSPKNIEMSNDSGSVSMLINSNTDWEIISLSYWLNVNKFNGFSNDSISIEYSENSSFSDRNGLMIISHKNISDTTFFIQKGINPFITTSKDSVFVNSDSSKRVISIESNVSWEITSTANWLWASPNSGNGNSAVTLYCLANNDSLERTKKLFIKNENFINELVVIQNGLDVFNIIVTEDSLEAGSLLGNGRYLKGSKVELIADANLGWEFSHWTENGTILSSDSIYTFIVTRNRNINAEFEAIATSIDLQKDLPIIFNLSQNYPNPFNPATTIQYSIPNLSNRINPFVTLKVFDILGDEITTIVNEEKPPGVYEVSFSANNLPSGIYYYKLDVGNFTETRKMTLLK